MTGTLMSWWFLKIMVVSFVPPLRLCGKRIKTKNANHARNGTMYDAVSAQE